MGAVGVRLRCIGLWAVGSEERCIGLWGSDGRCVRMPAVEVRWEVPQDACRMSQAGGAAVCRIQAGVTSGRGLQGRRALHRAAKVRLAVYQATGVRLEVRLGSGARCIGWQGSGVWCVRRRGSGGRWAADGGGQAGGASGGWRWGTGMQCVGL
jgi:hypothetical protein